MACLITNLPSRMVSATVDRIALCRTARICTSIVGSSRAHVPNGADSVDALPSPHFQMHLRIEDLGGSPRRPLASILASKTENELHPELGVGLDDPRHSQKGGIGSRADLRGTVVFFATVQRRSIHQ